MKKLTKQEKISPKNSKTDTTSPFNLLSKDIVKTLLRFNVIVLMRYNKGLEVLRVLYKELKLNIN